MVQDSTTYYVWIGGSCDYGHKEPTNEAREAVSKVNCTPKVRQKTFGVQFVYEKDICRKT